MSKEIKGTFFVLIAGIVWGLSGTCGQYIMSRSVPPLVLTNLRLLFAGVILSLLAYTTNKQSFKEALGDKKSLWSIFIFAVTGLVLNQLAYLIAIRETNAGTATVLQYICPVLVLTYSCIKDRVWPQAFQVLAIFLAMLGTFLIATHGDLSSLAITTTGLFWGLFSALTYALYIILPTASIRRFGSLTVMGIGMIMGSVLLLPISVLATYSWHLDLPLLAALFGMILLGTVFTYTVFLKGASLIGPVKSSLLASVEPIAAVFFAFWLMQERFYALDFVGMAAIIMAVLLVSLKDLLALKKKSI